MSYRVTGCGCGSRLQPKGAPSENHISNPDTFARANMPSTTRSLAALGRAIEEGNEKELDSLLSANPDLLEDDGLLCPSGISISPLMFAARYEQAGCARLLLKAGAQIDRSFGPDGDTPLIVSVSHGDVATAKVLIDAGADIGRADAHGRSPLYMSCFMSHPCCTALLVDANADLEQSTDANATPLYGAALGNRCVCCSHRCVAILCDAGAVVDASTVLGSTPMMVACQHGHLGLAMLLSSYGASREPHRFEGDLPKTWWARDLAEEMDHDDLVAFLDASDDFTPLHHIEVLGPERTLELLHGGAWSPIAGHVSPATRAKNYMLRNPTDEAAQLIVRAGQPWSPTTHLVWSDAHRTRARELLSIGGLLRKKLEDGSVLDWWVAHVMPHAVAWDVEPPLPTLPNREDKLDKPSVHAAVHCVREKNVWATRLRLRSKREADQTK